MFTSKNSSSRYIGTMNTLAITVFVFCFTGGVYSQTCVHRALQENIDFTKIKGAWEQTYYSPGSLYGEAICWKSKIYKVDTKRKELKMNIKLALPGFKKGTISHYTKKTTGFWGKVYSPVETSLSDHLMTDYKNYIIFYSCSEETELPIVGIELRENAVITQEIIDDIQDKLSPLDIDFYHLDERDNTYCNK